MKQKSDNYISSQTHITYAKPSATPNVYYITEGNFPISDLLGINSCEKLGKLLNFNNTNYDFIF